MTALIIEDEPRAANRLEKLLIEIDSSIDIVAKLESVQEGIRFLQSGTKVDVIFSDIQLADGLSFDIYKEFTSIPPIIFTTAYDQYAIKAFKSNGIDYLLKPLEKSDLEIALNKLKNLTTSINPALIELLSRQLNSPQKEYKNRFMVKIGQHIKSIATTEIKAFYSLEKTTYLLTNTNKNYIVDHSLDFLDNSLDPTLFFRTNRNFILHIQSPIVITAWSNSRLKIDLEGYAHEMIIVARNRTSDFKNWLGGT